MTRRLVVNVFSLLTLPGVLAAAAQKCDTCHRAEVNGFAHAAMHRALENGAEAPILREHKMLTKSLAGYDYRILRDGDKSIYTVKQGAAEISVPIEWAFGLGSAGQTYAFHYNGKWHESRVSYFSAIDGLDATMGADASAPANLEEAAGRVMDPDSARDCFGCHATGAIRNNALDLTGMIAGVQCERCHAGASEHAASASSSGAPSRIPPRLGKITTEEQADFCGQCHRSWSQIAAHGPRGVLNVRFQPYRLTNSKCYDAEDERIRCTSCHNPHAALETNAAAYDAKCLACHDRSARPVTGKAAKQCSVAQHDCVSCHMPKLDLPGAHKMFTDHMIRIVRSKEAYPG